MPIPPVFQSMSQAAAFILDHGNISDLMTPWQFSRFLAWLYEWSDGGTSLPALTLEFYRSEIGRLDSILNDDMEA